MKNGKEVILLVEGNAETGKEEKDFLEEKHYEVVLKTDGKEALEYLSKNPYDTDLVITALDIPLLDGIELLKLLKLSQRMKEVPVVVIIPESREEEGVRAMESGAEDVILRLCDKRAVANRIQNILVSKGRPMCVNVMEEILNKELDKCIGSLGVCRCRQCRKDVLTLALNRLKPRYVSSEKGRLLSIIDQMSYDYVPEMLRALTESAEIVKKNPRHQIY